MTSLLLVLILTGALHNTPPQMPGSTGICHAEEVTGVAGAPLPSPDLILRLQESAARERGRAEGAIIAIMTMPEQQTVAQQPSSEAQFHPLTAKEQQDLHLAMERFFQENRGKIIDARMGQELQPIVLDAAAGR
jgi:hypothetical protein